MEINKIFSIHFYKSLIPCKDYPYTFLQMAMTRASSQLREMRVTEASSDWASGWTGSTGASTCWPSSATNPQTRASGTWGNPMTERWVAICYKETLNPLFTAFWKRCQCSFIRNLLCIYCNHQESLNLKNLVGWNPFNLFCNTYLSFLEAWRGPGEDSCHWQGRQQPGVYGEKHDPGCEG